MVGEMHEVDDAVLNEYIQRAERLRRSRAFQEAKECYEKAVERCDELLGLNPRNAYLHYRKARVLYELKSFEGPDSAYARRLEDALVEIDRAVELDPEINYFHYFRSEVAGNLTRLPDWSLKAHWREELEMDTLLSYFSLSNYVRGFMAGADGAPLGCSVKELGDIEFNCKQYLERYPKDPDGYNNLGTVLHEQGMLNRSAFCVKDALRRLDEAVALNPSNPAYHNNRALALFSLIKLREAGWLDRPLDPGEILREVFSGLEKAVKLDPFNPLYHYNMGLMFCESKRFKEAIRELDQAIALDPSNPYFHYKRGMVLYKLGKYEESLEQLREALELEKDKRVVNYMIRLVEEVRDKQKGVIPIWRASIEVVTLGQEEDQVFLQPVDLQPDEILSRVKEVISIAGKFDLIDPNTPGGELEKLEKRLFEKLSGEKLSLNSLMLTLCYCCPAYWFDTEMIYGPEDYVELASDLSSITRGLLPLSGIECREVRLPGKQEPEKYVLSFAYEGKKYRVELPFEGDWAQYGPIVSVLNRIAERAGVRKQYVSLNTEDQTEYLIFCIPENYEACRKTMAELLRRWSSPTRVKDY